MRQAGLEGRCKKRWRKTTVADPAAEAARDLIQRHFGPCDELDRRYVGDITYIATWEGWAYLATVIDLAAAASSAGPWPITCAPSWSKTPSPWRSQPCTTAGRHFSFGQGLSIPSIRYSERLDENDIVASVGSRGDSYDNAMAEAFNSLYKWELIYPQGPWRGLDDVEFATLGYIDWFNHRRLHGEITDDNSYVTPAEFEATYYRQTNPPQRRLPNNPSSHGTRGGSPFESSKG